MESTVNISNISIQWSSKHKAPLAGLETHFLQYQNTELTNVRQKTLACEIQSEIRDLRMFKFSAYTREKEVLFHAH